MLRRASYIILPLLAATALRAQAPGADTVAVLRGAHERVVRLGARAGEGTWPGFRPDTIPHLYVLPGRGSLLFGWRGALPRGWTALPEGAAWLPEAATGAGNTGIEMEGRGVAQIVAGRLEAGALAGVTAHESFHVFQCASRVQGRRFGAGENVMLLADYPVFDVENEAGAALEGRLLLAALEAEERAEAARLAREFLAVRAIRHRRLLEGFAEFEDAAELNEGPAEYALHRATSPDALPPALRAGLADLLGDGSLSVRLRVYHTGSAMAHLLDRLGARDWKEHALANDLTLAGALTHAVGAPQDVETLAGAAAARHPELRERAAASVAAVRAARAARADSVLAAPGMLVRVSGERLGRRIDPCGFDPQNLLAVDERRRLHTRYLRACAGAFSAEFTTPVVEDGATFTAAAGERVRITAVGREVRLADGERIGAAAEVRIESSTITVTAPRADLERAGRTIIIHPLPPE